MNTEHALRDCLERAHVGAQLVSAGAPRTPAPEAPPIPAPSRLACYFTWALIAIKAVPRDTKIDTSVWFSWFHEYNSYFFESLVITFIIAPHLSAFIYMENIL